MSALRTVIVSPNRDAWSETFIRAHIERLPGEHLVLTDGFLPKRYEDGSAIMDIHGFAKFMRSVRLRLGSTWDREHAKSVLAVLKAYAPEVVLAEYGPTGSALLPICRRLGIPLVVHFHGVDAFSTKLLAEQDNYRALLSEAAAIVAVSREMEQQLLSLGAPRERLHYNCYGIDIERFTTGSPAASAKRFVAIGRFVEKKAPLLTLRAFHQAWVKDPEIRLTMIGDGPLKAECEAFVQANGLVQAVTFAGVLAHTDVANLLRSARAFVQHSVISGDNDHEGTPLAVLEAMATGIPVVATRHAGIPDVVRDGEHGLLCAEHDVEGMSGSISKLAADPDLAGRMGEAGRRNVEAHYTMRHTIEGLQRILLGVARGSAG